MKIKPMVDWNYFSSVNCGKSFKTEEFKYFTTQGSQICNICYKEMV